MINSGFEFELAQIKKSLANTPGSFKNSQERIQILLDAETQLKLLVEKYPDQSHLTVELSGIIAQKLGQTEYFILNDKCFEVIDRFKGSVLTSKEKIEVIRDLKVTLKEFVLEYPSNTKEINALLELFNEVQSKEMLSIRLSEHQFFIPEEVWLGFFTLLLVFSFWLLYRLLYKLLSHIFGPR